MTEDATSAGVKAQPPKRGVEYLFFLGLFVLWTVIQFWMLPKAGVSS